MHFDYLSISLGAITISTNGQQIIQFYGILTFLIPWVGCSVTSNLAQLWLWKHTKQSTRDFGGNVRTRGVAGAAAGIIFGSSILLPGSSASSRPT